MYKPCQLRVSFFCGGAFGKVEYVLYRQCSPKWQRSGPADTLVLRGIIVYKENQSFYLSSELVPPTPWPQVSVAPPPRTQVGGSHFRLRGGGGGGNFSDEGTEILVGEGEGRTELEM